MASTFKAVYPADSTALTMTGIGSLASSASFVAGFELGSISNRTTLDIDHGISGKIQVGTTPTVNTQIQIWVVPAQALVSGSPTWPDVFDGTLSAETVTSAGILQGAGRLAAVCVVDATTSNRDYPFAIASVRSLFGFVPWDYVVFVTHNTGVALNSTDGNHLVYLTRYQEQSV